MTTKLALYKLLKGVFLIEEYNKHKFENPQRISSSRLIVHNNK